MITEDKINQMYESAIECTRLTTQELKELGFNQHDLTNLVQQGRLIRIKKGQYEVIAKDLHDYGKSLLKSGKFEEAYRCFLACNELEPHNVNTLLQLFFRNIVNKNYEVAFKYFEEIFENSGCSNDKTADNYLYLYLLSHITFIPDNYQTLLKNISLEDIEIKRKGRIYPDLKFINSLREDILEQKFNHVLKKINSMKAKRGFSSLREIILCELLKQANEEKEKNMKSLVSYIESKDYTSVILLLEAEKEIHPLPITLEYVLTLAHDYLKIENTGVVPPLPNFGISNTFNAIAHKDYKRALELYVCHSELNSIPYENNVLYKVLVDINALVDSLSVELVGEEQLIFKGFESPKELEGEQLEIPNFVEEEVNYVDVVSSLIGKKVEEALPVIDKYFKQKGIEKYRYLFDSLLNICQLENDLSYSKAMLELANLSNPNYQLDISLYVQDFYSALLVNEYLIAQQYLNIIDGSNALLSNKINVEVLKETIATRKNKLERVEELEQPKPTIIVSEPRKKEEIASDLRQLRVNKQMNIDTDQQLVESKISVFETGEDVVILKSMDSERRKKIHQIVASIPSVKSFSIGSGSTRKVVLTNSPYIEGKINKRQLFVEGDKAYRENDYEKCISCYRQLLYLVKPNQKVYAKLGLCYLKKNDLDRAIIYLTISTELNKEQGGSYDFTELIERISGKPRKTEDEKKPIVKMSEDEFLDENNHYGITHIAEISRMVFSENISLEDACRRFNYDENQMSVIRLIYAEDYYSVGDYKSGDALLKLVAETKNKSKRVKTIMENVRLRKKFYKNRPRENNFVYMYK